VHVQLHVVYYVVVQRHLGHPVGIFVGHNWLILGILNQIFYISYSVNVMVNGKL